jgi:hypothetical protein
MQVLTSNTSRRLLVMVKETESPGPAVVHPSLAEYKANSFSPINQCMVPHSFSSDHAAVHPIHTKYSEEQGNCSCVVPVNGIFLSLC